MSCCGFYSDNLSIFSLLKQITQIPQNLLVARVKATGVGPWPIMQLGMSAKLATLAPVAPPPRGKQLSKRCTLGAMPKER